MDYVLLEELGIKLAKNFRSEKILEPLLSEIEQDTQQEDFLIITEGQNQMKRVKFHEVKVLIDIDRGILSQVIKTFGIDFNG